MMPSKAALTWFHLRKAHAAIVPFASHRPTTSDPKFWPYPRSEHGFHAPAVAIVTSLATIRK
jgi:hypothetical protein